MRRLVLVFVALAVCVPVGLAASATAPAGFAYGVAAGEITSTSAVLWTRAAKAGEINVAVMFGNNLAGFARGEAKLAGDLTVRLVVKDLRPGLRYRYVFRQGPAVSGGTFETAPVPTAKDRKSTRLNSSHIQKSRMPSSA